MPHDPILSADVHSWLLKAAADLRGAEIDLAAEPPLVEDALFHCQQAAEKSLKAFLVFHDVPFRKTHSIEEIGEAALAIDASFKTLVDRAAPLTEYAWVFRYPGPVPDPAPGEVQAAMEAARAIYQAVCNSVSDSSPP